VGFDVGDTVVHPGYGAGVVTEIKKLGLLTDEAKRYYAIELLSQPGTTIMVPVRDTDKVGLREPISHAQLSRVWRILRKAPGELPSDHNKRYALIKEKLHGGDVVEIAEAMRDLAWRREEKRHLTTRGKRLFDRGMAFLASEVAGVQGTDLESAHAEISDRLATSVSTAV
jgi:CarD family transcriptional regulator